MFRVVLDERKMREIDPTVAMLRDCVAETEKPGAKDEYTRERLASLRDFFVTMSGWYDQVDQLPTSGIIKFVKMGDKLRKLFGGG